MSKLETADSPRSSDENDASDRFQESHSHGSSSPVEAGKRPLRVGFVGAGFIADWHARAMRRQNAARLVAVCDRSRTRAEALSAAYSVENLYTSMEEMFENASLDAVHLLLPPEMHYEAARCAIDHGVHVFLEKPFCTTAHECNALIEHARRHRIQLGVGHNFLYLPAYQELRKDLNEGVLGRIDQITINWSRELPQIQCGPFQSWLFERPENLILEVGPHSIAHMLDLLGIPSAELSMTVRAGNPTDLPGGRIAYRRWIVDAEYRHTAVRLLFSFVPGYTEHTVHVRGSLASATADLEQWTYHRHAHSQYQYDFDRYHMASQAAREQHKQARKNLLHYVLSKAHLSERGSHYELSIRRAQQAFYAGLLSEPDYGISSEFGRDVVATCQRIGDLAGLPEQESEQERATPTVVSTATNPKILVLGATGFIGRELVRQLTESGQSVRALVRQVGRLESGLDRSLLDIRHGNAADPEDLRRAMEGVDMVFHLARAYGNTWDEFCRFDIPMTENVARACLQKEGRQLIYTSTIDCYFAGKSRETITEATPLDRSMKGRKPYTRAKAASEAMLLEMHANAGLPVTLVRPGIVVGRGGSPFHWGVGMFADNAVAHLWGDGTNPLPFVLVQDVAAGLRAMAGRSDLAGQSFNLIGDPLMNAREYVSELERIAEIKMQVLPTPIYKYYLADLLKYAVKVAVRHPGRYQPTYRDWVSRTQRAYFDCSKAKRELNWNPCTDRDRFVQMGIEQPVEEFLY